MHSKNLLSISLFSDETCISSFETYWNSRSIDESAEDWLSHLKNDNERGLQLLSWYPKVVLSDVPAIPEIVSSWCQQFKLPPAVLFRTIEIYDTFISNYSRDLYFERQPKQHHEDTCQHWQEIFAELKHQSLLHLVSCFQIASKLELSYKVITIKKAATLLTTARRPCDQSTILLSEIQVLITLKYDVNYAPIIEYVETLMCQLMIMAKKQKEAKSNPFLLYIDEIHSVAKMLILMVCFDRKEILQKIVSTLYSDISPDTRDYRVCIRKVHLDKILMAAAVVCAASFLVEPLAASVIMKDIHASVNTDLSDVATISSILVSHLNPDSESVT